MAVVVTIITCLLGSAGVFSFIQFLINRKDKRNETLVQISGRLDDMNANIQTLSDTMVKNNAELREEMVQTQAITARVRILRASDEILHKMKHSKEWFDQLNEDITFYNDYCNEHPKFVNNKAMHAIANIDEVYAKALKDNDFL